MLAVGKGSDLIPVAELLLENSRYCKLAAETLSVTPPELITAVAFTLLMLASGVLACQGWNMRL